MEKSENDRKEIWTRLREFQDLELVRMEDIRLDLHQID